MGTYSALIRAMAKGNQPEQALDIFKEMQQHGIVSNIVTYRALIRVLEKGKGGRPEQALEIFQGNAAARHSARSYIICNDQCLGEGHFLSSGWTFRSPWNVRNVRTPPYIMHVCP